MNRQEQKRKTRRTIIDAAFRLLDEKQTLSTISLREVARNAGIAPTSFYRHFNNIDELGLTLVDEAGLALRQLMRQARIEIATGTGIINTSVDTFMLFTSDQSNVFRLLLREHAGTSVAFKAAVLREIQHFIDELSDFIRKGSNVPAEFAFLQADAMVKLVFSAGAEIMEADKAQREMLASKLKKQLLFIAKGANSLKPRL
jgi:AcrR family transcriptional regulator